MSVCSDHTPLLCLAAAVLAFSAGLVIWTIAADLSLAVKICVGTMTGTTFVVLLVVVIWEVVERWQEHLAKCKDRNEDEPAPDNTELRPEIQVLHSRWQKWRARTEKMTETSKEKSTLGYWSTTGVARLFGGLPGLNRPRAILPSAYPWSYQPLDENTDGRVPNTSPDINRLRDTPDLEPPMALCTKSAHSSD